jgi:photosystem II stability/assembly factor-like uncharacterized protein
MALRKALLVLLLGALLTPWSAAFANKYDVLELPATPSEKAIHSSMFFVGKFGNRYFAAGQMGHILYSDDNGTTWTQAQVPVRSTILDVYFVNDQLGWAVGHEGLILHSSDGGKSWVKQYDGLRYGQEGLAYYTALSEQNPDNELYPALVGEMEFAIDQGADKPLFKVYFHDENYGHAIGAYGMALVTRDGGTTWTPNLENYENDNFNHMFDFAPLPDQGRFFITGEAGLFLIGDINIKAAKRVHSVPWEGSFFASVAAGDGAIVLGGLRGRMFRTADEGQSWIVVEKPPTSALVASTRTKDGRLVFGGVAGEILVSTDEGFTFTLAAASPQPIFDMAEGDGNTLLIAGPKGILSVTLAPQ